MAGADQPAHTPATVSKVVFAATRKSRDSAPDALST
jgi:hypothetical protein